MTLILLKKPLILILNLEVPDCLFPDPSKLINGRTKQQNQKATVFPQSTDERLF